MAMRIEITDIIINGQWLHMASGMVLQIEKLLVGEERVPLQEGGVLFRRLNIKVVLSILL